jgi:hypothetical protein
VRKAATASAWRYRILVNHIKDSLPFRTILRDRCFPEICIHHAVTHRSHSAGLGWCESNAGRNNLSCWYSMPGGEQDSHSVETAEARERFLLVLPQHSNCHYDLYSDRDCVCWTWPSCLSSTNVQQCGDQHIITSRGYYRDIYACCRGHGLRVRGITSEDAIVC